MEKFEASPDLQSETITGAELYAEIFNSHTHEPDPRFVDKERGGVFHYTPFDSEIHEDGVAFSVVRERGTIVGFAKVRENPFQNGTLWLMSVNVDNERKGEGISRKVIEEVFSYAKSRGMKLQPSSYTDEGAERVKHQIERLADQYGVEIVR